MVKTPVEKSTDYIFNLIENPGRCECWPGCAKKYIAMELKKLVKRSVPNGRKRG